MSKEEPALSRRLPTSPVEDLPDRCDRILLIDDDEDSYLVCRAHLQHISPGAYQLDWAGSYDEGLEAAVSGTHDLYLVDVFLEDGPNGVELIERARAAGNRAPMIVLTRYPHPALDERNVLVGGTDYLDKSEITGPLFERTIRYALERSRTERRLLASEQVYRSLFQHNPHLVFGLAPHGRFLMANPAFVRLLGVTEAALVGTSIADFVSPRHRTRAARLFEDTVALGPQQFGLSLQFPDGRDATIEGTSVAVHTGDGVAGVYVFAEDTALRRRSEARIRFQADLLDAVGQAVIATDPDGLIQYWNEAATRLYGWKPDEVVDRPIAEVLGTTGKADGAAVASGSGEVQHRRRDGSEFPAYVTNAVILDAEGSAVAVVSIASDLTERKLLETQLLQSTKLEAVGRLAGGVAHDFNNILTTILGFSQLALDEISDLEVRGYISETLRSAQRAQDLTRQLLAFSRQQLLQPQVIDLRDTIKDMERMLHRTLGEDIRLTVDGDVMGARVRVDPGQAEQVVLNLALNARDAMPTGGRLTIATDLATLEPRHSREFGFPVVPGDYVRLTVSDTGSGMSPDVLSRVFDPFFTTKPDSGGTGLGLAMVYGIVKQSGGHIRAISQSGRGSTFEVYLPRCSQEVDADLGGEETNVTAAGNGRVVLVVEDEDAVRRMIRRVLERNGYEVVDAADGMRALELARKVHERLALILSDVVMPGMSGRDVVEQLDAEGIRPRVIYMSGYTRDEMIRKGLQEASFTFLPKPFLPAELLEIVGAELAADG